jgi:hypothetical protein
MLLYGIEALKKGQVSKNEVKERLVVDVALWLLHFSIFGVLQLFLVKERLVVDVALWSLLYGLYGLQG